AGYAIAQRAAKESGLDLPMQESSP
ncbi:MAG: hypothetical protein FD130_1046, partial [Halothiobacillaceae bacterium]